MIGKHLIKIFSKIKTYSARSKFIKCNLKKSFKKWFQGIKVLFREKREEVRHKCFFLIQLQRCFSKKKQKNIWHKQKKKKLQT